MQPQKAEALRLLEDSLKELENPKGSVSVSVQKLSRASNLLGEQDILVWCGIQMGDRKYTDDLDRFNSLVCVRADEKMSAKQDELRNKEIDKVIEKMEESFDFKMNFHWSSEEALIKFNKASGGYSGIGFLEDKYAHFVKSKRANDGTFYVTHLLENINFVKKTAYGLASNLLNKVKFSGTISNSFDVLKTVVDDKLLDLNPELAEQLMLAFKSISSSKKEEWSQALTTCRRLLEGLADELMPASDQPLPNGKTLKQNQYVNRLWAFMDKAIESDSNKALAKAHVDLLGSWMEKINKIANKGVHDEVSQIEAVKAVFHTYLMIADILEYLQHDPNSTKKPHINKASLDELEALLGVPRTVAKEIIKLRVKEGDMTIEMLKTVNGIGQKTIQTAESAFIFGENPE